MYVRRYRAIFPPKYGPMAFSKKAIWNYDPERPAVRIAEKQFWAGRLTSA